MIRWIRKEEGEGQFKSTVFQNEDGDELFVYTKSGSPDILECAERCVEAFNHLPEPVIDEICKKLICCAEEGGLEEGPASGSPRGILNDCWFVALYVDMGEKDDEIAYAVEGEGDWGENIGFYIRGGRVVYVGTDYLDYMINTE